MTYRIYIKGVVRIRFINNKLYYIILLYICIVKYCKYCKTIEYIYIVSIYSILL